MKRPGRGGDSVWPETPMLGDFSTNALSRCQLHAYMFARSTVSLRRYRSESRNTEESGVSNGSQGEKGSVLYANKPKYSVAVGFWL